MFTIDEGVEGFLGFERIFLKHRSDRALRDENSSAFDVDGMRGNSAFDEPSLVNPDASCAFEISHCLAVRRLVHLSRSGRRAPHGFPFR